jgi:anti-sigma factor RsiW
MAEPTEDDLLLTAFLDGELPRDEQEAVATRMTSEPKLRARLEELRRGQVILQSALVAVLAEAPRANMTAKLAEVNRFDPALPIRR